jgi:hypothetical protein
MVAEGRWCKIRAGFWQEICFDPDSMLKRKTIGLLIRLALLLPVLAAAVVISYWSQRADPRFYYFLTTRPGMVLARVLHWKGTPGCLEDEDKTFDQMTVEEQRALARLEEQILHAAPSHRLVLKDGKSMWGRLVDDGPRFIRFRESYGSSGSLSARIRRDRVLSLEPVAAPAPNITYRDVKYSMAFPDMNLYKRAPFTIVTDEEYFRVEHTVRLLQRLHQEFMEAFGPLVREKQDRDSIQILFFSDEANFREHQKQYAPRMESSVGFYSPWTDRFVVFNHHNSEQMQDFGRRLAEQAERYKQKGAMYGGNARIDAWQAQAGQRMSNLAEQQTRETIRHEGAHQLFFTYGVHSTYRMENEWLFEGLAVYCESDRLGRTSPHRAGVIKQALDNNRLIPVEELVNHRSPDGLFSFGAQHEVDLAYTQSWALVDYLMQPRQREKFFDYIRHVRDPGAFRDVLHASRYDLLCQFMGQSPEEFASGWKAHIRTL